MNLAFLIVKCLSLSSELLSLVIWLYTRLHLVTVNEAAANHVLHRSEQLLSNTDSLYMHTIIDGKNGDSIVHFMSFTMHGPTFDLLAIRIHEYSVSLFISGSTYTYIYIYTFVYTSCENDLLCYRTCSIMIRDHKVPHGRQGQKLRITDNRVDFSEACFMPFSEDYQVPRRCIIKM